MGSRRNMGYSSRPTRASRNAHARGDREFRTYDTSFIQSNRRNGIPTAAALLLALVAVALLGFMASKFISCSEVEMIPEGTEVTVTIPEGATTTEIAQTLVKAGLIPDATSFTSLVKQANADGALKPGTYKLVGGSSAQTLVDTLLAGPPVNSFTIPEGYTIARTAQAVEEAYGGTITADQFIEAAHSASTYEQDFPFVAGAFDNSLEGFLFPKTYPIDEGDTADTVIRKMLSQYQQETQSLDYSYIEGQGYTPYDVLKMASVIEREASESNRPTVASVFYNRLNQGMYLQSDATVAYVVDHDPTPEDLGIDSVYNTYLYAGLPAGPICSPSLECLQAACQPEETNYLYFYFWKDEADQMQYAFSETYEQHQEVIANAPA